MTRRLSAVLLILLLAVPTFAPRAADPAEAALARMTLAQKVGQLIVIRTWGESVAEQELELLSAIQPGGIVLMKQNIADSRSDGPERLITLTNGLQTWATANAGRVPLLIMTDQEGRKIQRLRAGFTPLPNPLAIGAITNPAAAELFGRQMGREMAEVGVNMALAPVLDLTDQPNHPIMGGRVMGSDPTQVGRAGREMMAGLKASGVIGTAKHYPGHGRVADTHVGPATLSGTRAEIEAREIAPFKAANAPVIMLGHMSVPALDPSGLPATLSPAIIADLRTWYNGVIMTDALDMGAILQVDNRPEVRAIQAGVDLLLLGGNTSPSDQISASRAILQAVERGEIPLSRIEEAALRVLRLKAEYGLLDGWQPLPSLYSRYASQAAAVRSLEVMQAIYSAAFTVIKNEGGLIPFRAGQKVGVVYPNGYPMLRGVCGGAARAAEADGFDVRPLPVNPSPVAYQRGQAAKLAGEVDVIVVFTQNADQDDSQVSLVRALPPEKTVVVALDSIYDIRRFPDVAAYALIYDYTDPAFYAACYGLFGQFPVTGRLPMPIGAEYPAGAGIDLNPTP